MMLWSVPRETWIVIAVLIFFTVKKRKRDKENQAPAPENMPLDAVRDDSKFLTI